MGNTISQTGHLTAFSPSSTPLLLLPPVLAALVAIMSRIAVFSKLWGHFLLVTGSLYGRSVSGHLMLILSLAMARSSSSSAAASWPFAFARVRAELMGDSEGNQVVAFGSGGASSPGCRASWTTRLKPM